MEAINLNKAYFGELQEIVHIGAKRANKIIAARPFKDIYELSKVKGLGKNRMDAIIAQGIICV